jgi:hypothetical protein
MRTIETLRNLQVIEMENGFPNGQLYNDLEDMIYKLENNIYNEQEIEVIQGEVYGGKTREELNKIKGL